MASSVSGLTDLLASIKSRIDSGLEELGIISPESMGPPDGGGRFSPSPSNPDLIRFKYQNRPYVVSSIELTMFFTIGRLVLTKLPNAALNPSTEIFGVPENIRAFLAVLGVLPPGEYTYRISTSDQVTTMPDFVYDSRLVGSPNQGNFAAGNSVKNYQTPPIPCLDLKAITVFLDNQTNQSASLNLLAALDANVQANGVLSTITVASNTLLLLAAALDTDVIPYMAGQAVFATAPTSGYLRLIPFGKRA